MQRWKAIGILAIATAASTGCHGHTNAVDKSAFQTALNDYYNAQKTCLFDTSLKLPAQADTKNEDQTKGFDALTDAGMLNRTPAEKQRFLIGSKQVNDYDLTDKGRSTWTADQTQPGYGNFCFGSPQVTGINNYTALDSNGDMYTVGYQYSVNLPSWVKTDEMMSAFPNIDRMSAPRTATANLIKGGNGWQVQHVSSSGSPAS